MTGEVRTQNTRGEWVPSIPLPFYGRGNRCTCQCNRRFKGDEAYQGHYALVHILGMPDPTAGR